MVTERAIKIECFRRCHSNFDLIFSPGVSHNFPVMDAPTESIIGNDGPKNIGLLFQKHVSVALRKHNTCAECIGVPCESITADVRARSSCWHHSTDS